MSMFLPEGPYQTQPPSGVADITPAETETTSADIALMQRVLSAASRNPNLIPQDFMAYVFDWIQTQRLQIPIGQVFGFTQFTATVEQVDGTDTTTSTTYVTPSTSGPVISGLADGQYLVVLRAALAISSGSTVALASMSYNGSAPLDSEAAVCGVTSGSTSCIGIGKVTLANNGNNTIETQFKSGLNTATATLGDRTLVALRFAN